MKYIKRISTGILTSIVLGTVFVCLLLALVIVNLFFPVRYFLAFARQGEPIERGEMRVTFIDVGYGDCTLVEFPDGKVALIDSGDGSYEHVNTILKALNERAIDKIDYLIGTTVKDEHCGGFAEIIEYKKVTKAFVPYCKNLRINDSFYAFTQAIKDKNIDYTFYGRGDGIVGEKYDYFLTFLSPTPYINADGAYDLMNSDPTPTNVDNASAVIWLEYGDASFAFSSDARKGAFEEIINGYNLSVSLSEEFCPFEGHSVDLSKCKVVSVSGHGGEDNACTDWYETLNPETAVVSVGNNFAGCPSAAVITTVSNFSDVYMTKYDGTITITCKDGQITISKEKQ